MNILSWIIAIMGIAWLIKLGPQQKNMLMTDCTGFSNHFSGSYIVIQNLAADEEVIADPC